MTDAANPARSPVQSKNMWNESEIRPKLLVQMPYISSTKAKLKFNSKKKNKFRELRSDRISRVQLLNFSRTL